MFIVCNAFWFESWVLESHHCWIESKSLDLYYYFLLDLFFEMLNWFTNISIISTFFWKRLIRFKVKLIRINLQVYKLSISRCLNLIILLVIRITTLFLANFLHLPLISISSYIHNTPKTIELIVTISLESSSLFFQ